MQRKKGISLIVLVITIIVMIILAAAIIISLTNNGIIGRANQAVDATNLSEVQHLASVLWGEARLKGYTTKEQYEDYITEGLKGTDTTDFKIKVTTSGVTVTAKVPGVADLPEDLVVGDIVEYAPASSYTASSPYVVSNEDTANLKLAGCEGSFYSEDLAASTVQWKVLSVDRDAGTIEIIPNAVSTAKVSLTGAHGYNNAIDALHTICGAVYGNTTSANYTATAESMDMEDIQKIESDVSWSYGVAFLNVANTEVFPLEYLREKGITTEFTEEEIANGYAYRAIDEDRGPRWVNINNSLSSLNNKFTMWLGLENTYYLAEVAHRVSGSKQYFDIPTVSRNTSYNFATGESYLSVQISSYAGALMTSDLTTVATLEYSVRPVVTMSLKKELSFDKKEVTGDSTINYWVFE